MKKNLILSFFLLLFVFSFAQEEATTTDGRKILIYPDGTWKPSRIETVSEIHPASIEHLELPRPSAHGQMIKHTGYTLSYNPDFHIAAALVVVVLSCVHTLRCVLIHSEYTNAQANG